MYSRALDPEAVNRSPSGTGMTSLGKAQAQGTDTGGVGPGSAGGWNQGTPAKLAVSETCHLTVGAVHMSFL